MTLKEMRKAARDEARVIDDFGAVGTVICCLANDPERCIVSWADGTGWSFVHHARIQLADGGQ